MKAVASDLKAIYSAATEAEAEFNLELKARKVGWALSQHQQIVASPLDPRDPVVCLLRRHP
jgi:hypothetical protein